MRRGVGQRYALPQQLGSHYVSRQVAVAESEPRILAQPAQRFERGERLSDDAPARFGVGQPGQGVHYGIEIGRDVKAVERLIVAGVDHDSQVGRFEYAA